MFSSVITFGEMLVNIYSGDNRNMERQTVSLTLHLKLRDWDWITPILLGDVRTPGLDLRLTRVENLLGLEDDTTDGWEVSLSRYAQAIAAGDLAQAGLPVLLMRGFRHRCIITRDDGPERLQDLAGGRIGLTGWQDSGNIWTRAALSEAGVGIGDAHWFAGRLTSQHPVEDRLAGFGLPGRIDAAPGERPLMELLADGALDAVCTPFMPRGFFAQGSGFRQVLPDYPQAEAGWFARRGHVPGMHLLALRPELVARHPELPELLARAFEQSQRLWMDKRRRYADTTPWIIEDIARADRTLGSDWITQGFTANAPMFDDFLREAHQQGILPRLLTAAALFPHISQKVLETNA